MPPVVKLVIDLFTGETLQNRQNFCHTWTLSKSRDSVASSVHHWVLLLFCFAVIIMVDPRLQYCYLHLSINLQEVVLILDCFALYQLGVNYSPVMNVILQINCMDNTH